MDHQVAEVEELDVAIACNAPCRCLERQCHIDLLHSRPLNDRLVEEFLEVCSCDMGLALDGCDRIENGTQLSYERVHIDSTFVAYFAWMDLG